MELPSLSHFLILSLVFIAIPGPNVAIIVATSIQKGAKAGLQTVAGTSTAMAIQLLIAAVGTSGFLLIVNDGLVWLKWAGVFYLAYLGVNGIIRALSKDKVERVDLISSFTRGFLVSLTNPKTILFFSAFLPQFVSESANYVSQLILLSFIFWLAALLIDGTYALAAHKIKERLSRSRTLRRWESVSGVMYLTASGLLAVSDQ